MRELSVGDDYLFYLDFKDPSYQTKINFSIHQMNYLYLSNRNDYICLFLFLIFFCIILILILIYFNFRVQRLVAIAWVWNFEIADCSETRTRLDGDHFDTYTYSRRLPGGMKANSSI